MWSCIFHAKQAEHHPALGRRLLSATVAIASQLLNVTMDRRQGRSMAAAAARMPVPATCQYRAVAANGWPFLSPNKMRLQRGVILGTSLTSSGFGPEWNTHYSQWIRSPTSSRCMIYRRFVLFSVLSFLSLYGHHVKSSS